MRTGYTFKGWYTEKTGGTKISESTVIKNDITFCSQWKANKYRVRFEANSPVLDVSFTLSSGVIAPFTSKMVAYDLAYGTLPTPTRPGYVLKGW